MSPGHSLPAAERPESDTASGAANSITARIRAGECVFASTGVTGLTLQGSSVVGHQAGANFRLAAGRKRATIIALQNIATV